LTTDTEKHWKQLALRIKDKKTEWIWHFQSLIPIIHTYRGTYTHRQTYRYLPVYIQHLGWGSFHQTLVDGMESFCRGPVAISFHHHHQTISCNSPTSHSTECFIVITILVHKTTRPPALKAEYKLQSSNTKHSDKYLNVRWMKWGGRC
jgi:hypothetical protein